LGLVLTDASRQKENRIALVAEIIGDEVKQLLCDAERINRIFPQPKPEKKKRVTDAATSSLNQMGPSQRGRCFLITMVDYWRFTRNRTRYTTITG
jgi:putative DNA primase/helicase